MTSVPEQNPLVDDFRGAMRRLGSGVAIVTTAQDGKDYGIVMTSVTSLSFEPPSLLIAVNQTASACGPILESGHFRVNLLTSSQCDFCKTFAALPSNERFQQGNWKRSDDGLLYLEGAQSVLTCKVGTSHLSGTHQIITGLITGIVNAAEVDALLFINRQYGRFHAHP